LNIYKQELITMPLSAPQRKANLRLALILASVAGVFLLGFVTKIAWLAN
jgi:hypothetical protein